MDFERIGPAVAIAVEAVVDVALGRRQMLQPRRQLRLRSDGAAVPASSSAGVQRMQIASAIYSRISAMMH